MSFGQACSTQHNGKLLFLVKFQTVRPQNILIIHKHVLWTSRFWSIQWIFDSLLELPKT